MERSSHAFSGSPETHAFESWRAEAGRGPRPRSGTAGASRAIPGALRAAFLRDARRQTSSDGEVDQALCWGAAMIHAS